MNFVLYTIYNIVALFTIIFLFQSKVMKEIEELNVKVVNGVKIAARIFSSFPAFYHWIL